MNDEKKIGQIRKSAETKAKRQRFFGIFLVAVIFLAFVIIAFENLFNVKTVTVEGISAAVPYKASDVEEFLGIDESTNLITYDANGAELDLMYKFPYIENVEIKKSFPSTLKIIITENKGRLYLELGDDVFVLSSSGKVLEVVEDPFYDGNSRTKLLANEIRRCVCGENIVFEKTETLDILKSIAEQLDKYGLSEKITEFDLRDKFDIKLIYDNRLIIQLGSFEQPENKIKLFADMISNKIWEDTTAEIDISNGSEALVKFTGNVAN